MSLRITAGKVVPDTDKERVQVELRKFETEAAPRILKHLSDAIHAKEEGWVRFSAKLRKGEIVSVQILLDFTMGLTGDSAAE